MNLIYNFYFYINILNFIRCIFRIVNKQFNKIYYINIINFIKLFIYYSKFNLNNILKFINIYNSILILNIPLNLILIEFKNYNKLILNKFNTLLFSLKITSNIKKKNNLKTFSIISLLSTNLNWLGIGNSKDIYLNEAYEKAIFNSFNTIIYLNFTRLGNLWLYYNKLYYTKYKVFIKDKSSYTLKLNLLKNLIFSCLIKFNISYKTLYKYSKLNNFKLFINNLKLTKI